MNEPSDEDVADMAAMEARGKPVVMLRPRLASDGSLPPGTSKMGGMPDLPREMRWPRCPQCDVPMNFVMQLFRRDLPPLVITPDPNQPHLFGSPPVEDFDVTRLLFPDRHDHFVLFRCRSEDCGGSVGKPLHWAFVPNGSKTSPRPQPKPIDDDDCEDGFDERIPECRFHPLLTIDYPSGGGDDVREWWGEVYERMYRRQLVYGGEATRAALEDFQYRVHARDGTKIGGFAAWRQGEDYATCTCGRRKQFIFQIASNDADDPDRSEPPRPLGQRSWSDHGIMIGDLGNIYFQACPACGPPTLEWTWDCG